MNLTQRIRRGAVAASAVALFAAATFGGAAAHAATPTPTHDSGAGTVEVTVPSAEPTTPSGPPPGAGPGGDGPNAPGPSDPGPSGPSGQAGTAPAPDPAPAAADPGCVPAEPAVPTKAAATGNPVTVDREVYLPGQNVAATAPGFGAGEQVQLVLFSDPTLIGTFTADESGAVHAVFPLAAETPSGTHSVQFTGWCKTVALANILVGATGASSAPGIQGVPVWMWWVGGGLAAAIVGFGGWWLLRAMRTAPAAVTS